MARVKTCVAAMFSALAVGCTQQQAPPSDGGGSPQAPLGRVIWKDATGATVAKDALLFIDDRNFQWNLDPETAKPVDTTGTPLFFDAPNCAGGAYVSRMPPRQPFKVVGETQYRVRPDGAASKVVAYASIRTKESGCGNAAGSTLLLPLASAPSSSTAQDVSFAFVPPLHQERE